MDTTKTGKAEPSRPVMVRVSLEMWEKLHSLARREESSIATVLRRLARERLEQLEQERTGQ